jgi:16S rRNA (guanine966-N2)-methyltransferase
MSIAQQSVAVTDNEGHTIVMRIVAGRFKGRTIAAPEGHSTRPTSERAREAIFNVLEHAAWSSGIADARVLDLFAGSGALGFEALSRGAAFALFVETEAAARGALRDTIEAFGLFGVTRIHRRDATDLGTKPAGLGDPFDLVFLDPPYRCDLGPRALAACRDGGWLSPSARLVLEVGADEKPQLNGFELLDDRVYGAARVLFLRAP